MNIVEVDFKIKSEEEELTEYMYYNKEYKDKREGHKSVQDMLERIIRDNIYDNPMLNERIVQTKELSIIYTEDILDRIIIKNKEIYHKLSMGNTKVSSIIYGIETNYSGELIIEIGSEEVYKLEVKEFELFYLPLPILVFHLFYHELIVKIKNPNIPLEDIIIKTHGIKISKDLIIFLIQTTIQIERTCYRTGMFGVLYKLNQKKIEDVYEDYVFINKIPIIIKSLHLNLSIYNMKIIEFHNKNRSYKKRIIDKTRMISYELVERTWSPYRVEYWCLPIDNA